MVAEFQGTSKLNTNPYWWLMGSSAVKVWGAVAVMLPDNVLPLQRVVLTDRTLEPKDGGAQNGWSKRRSSVFNGNLSWKIWTKHRSRQNKQYLKRKHHHTWWEKADGGRAWSSTGGSSWFGHFWSQRATPPSPTSPTAEAGIFQLLEPPGAAFLLVPQRVGHFCIGPQRSFSRTFTSNLICPVNCPQIHSLTPHFCHYIKRHSWASLRLRDEEAACQCRKHESDHWSGKIPHAVEQLNPCAAITEPVL